MWTPETVGISTDVPGIVQTVDVVGQRVRSAPAKLLYRLDPRQYQIALDNAKANLAQTALTIDAMKQDYKRMVSDVAAEQSQVVLDQTNYVRDTTLLRSGTVSQAIYDQTQSTLETDKSKLESLRQQAQVQLAQLDGNADIPATQHPQYTAGASQGRGGATPARSHRHLRAVCRPGHRCFGDSARKISRRLNHGLLSGRYRSRLD